jgi:hypothetical protein
MGGDRRTVVRLSIVSRREFRLGAEDIGMIVWKTTALGDIGACQLCCAHLKQEPVHVSLRRNAIDTCPKDIHTICYLPDLYISLLKDRCSKPVQSAPGAGYPDLLQRTH